MQVWVTLARLGFVRGAGMVRRSGAVKRRGSPVGRAGRTGRDRPVLDGVASGATVLAGRLERLPFSLHERRYAGLLERADRQGQGIQVYKQIGGKAETRPSGLLWCGLPEQHLVRAPCLSGEAHAPLPLTYM